MFPGKSSSLRAQASDIPDKSRMNLENFQSAINILKKEGALQIVYVKGDGKDQPASVAFKRIGVFERLRTFFLSSDQKQQMAKDAVQTIQTVFGIKDDDALRKIEDDIKSDGMIRGARFADNFMASINGLSPSDNPGHYIATASGAEVGLASPQAECISADYKVMDFESAKLEVESRLDSKIQPSLQPWEAQIEKNHYQNKLDAMFAGTEPGLKVFTEDGYGILSLPSDESKSDLLHDHGALIAAIARTCNHQGSVVMRPGARWESDLEKKYGGEWVFTDEILKTQLRAAHDAHLEAKAQGKNFKITFVGLDSGLMLRMRRLHDEVKKDYKN